jgi:hypothetical protein
MKFQSVAALLLAASLAAGEQQTAKGSAGPDPAKAPIIDELFRLTRPETMMQQFLAQYKAVFSNAAQTGFADQVRKLGDDPGKYQPDFQKMEDQVFALVASRLDWSKLKPQIAKVYSDTFSKEELSGLVAFYKSPTGKAAMEKLPGLMAKCSEIGQQQMASAGPEIQKITMNFMNSIKQKSQASHAGSSPAKPK